MSESVIRLTVRIVLSLGLMAAGLYILISSTGNSELEKASYTWIGLITGYWLR